MSDLLATLDTLPEAGPLPAAQAARLLRQAAESLRDVHARQAVHCSASAASPDSLSPEQATGRPADRRSDIYWLGITAFRLLAGRPPFQAESKAEVLLAHVTVPLPDLHDFVRCDDRLVKVVEKMCAKDPAQRHQSCDELLQALDGLPVSLGGSQPEGEAPAEALQLSQEPLELARPQRKAKASPPAPLPARARQRPLLRRPPISRPPFPELKWKWLVALGASALLLVLLAALLRSSFSPLAAFRVPRRGWVAAGPPAPPVKKVQRKGGYGNCVFSARQIDRGREDAAALRTTFSALDPIYGRCYFAGRIGANKSGEVWQELWIDGVKRAQVIYDPALPEDEDQLPLDLGRRHGARVAELSPGKHTLDVWIYRQPEDAENPQPLAAGELVVRR